MKGEGARSANPLPVGRSAQAVRGTAEHWSGRVRVATSTEARKCRFLVTLAATLALTACAVPTQYMGIDLAGGSADLHLRSLAERARSGDKHAQYQLGLAFESGDGVPRDCRKAMKLYRVAAAPSGGTMFVYMPPVGRNGRGTVVPLNTGPPVPGLPMARERLKTLQLNDKTGRC